MVLATLQDSATGVDAYRVRVFRGPAGLDEVAGDWERLTDALKNRRFYHLIDWYKCYLEALEEDPPAVYFFAIYRGAEARAIFPLKRSVRRCAGIIVRGWELPNHPHMPLGDFIVADDEAQACIALLLKALQSSPELCWDYLYLPKILGEATACSALASNSDFIATRQQVAQCNYLPVIPYEQKFQQLSSSFRKHLRRARKKLAQLDSAHYAPAVTPEDLRDAYPKFLEVEASGWKGAQGCGTAIKLDPRLSLFYQRIMELYGARDGCEITVLQHGDRPIAAQFLLIVGDTVYKLKIGYDEMYAQVAPGHSLTEHLLQSCEDRHGSKYVNMTSNAAWHAPWKPLQLDVFDVCIYRRSWRGRLAYGCHHARRLAHRLARRCSRVVLRRVRGRNQLRWFVK